MRFKKSVPGIVLALVMVVTSLTFAACDNEPPCDSIPIRFFPQQKGQTGMEALLTGNLVFTDAILHIETKSGTSYLPIWPNGYKVCAVIDGTIDNGFPGTTYHSTTQILNKSGHVVALVGKEVVMGGGEVPDTEANRKWLNDEIMKQPLPSSVTGPFWLVGDGVHINISGSTNNESSQVPANGPTQSIPSVKDGTPLEGDAAMLRLAEAYGADVGVSVDEAMRRLKQQDIIGELGATIAENEKATFAGMWIQHEPDYRLIVQFTSNGEATISRYIQESRFAEMAPIIEVRTASVPLTVLEAEQNEAMRICDQLGLVVSSDTDIYTNSVQLYVTDRKPLDDALQKAGIQLPDHVKVVELNELDKPDSSPE